MWALVQDDVVREVTEINPADRFHADLTWKPCDQEVAQGWYFDGVTFRQPLQEPGYLAGIERAWRDAQVSASEWLVTRHRDEQDLSQETTLTAAQFSELLVYRQALRDWPQSSSFPGSQYRPEAPLWLAEQTQ